LVISLLVSFLHVHVHTYTYNLSLHDALPIYLKECLEMQGTVRNVVDFGVFVDIGVKEDGLVHISKLANRFVKHPMDVVSVGDIRSEEHTSELQSRFELVCRLLLEKKK